MKKPEPKAANVSVKLIKDLLRGGISVTIGGVPIQITLGAGAAPALERPAKAAAAAPKPRKKARRRRAKRAVMPDPRDVRGYLATRMEGATLTVIAGFFKVKRPLMKKLLARMLAHKEITLFKGAFFNSKRLRQRRIESKFPMVDARAAAPIVVEESPAAPEAPPPAPPAEVVAEAPALKSVPEPEADELEPVEHPERNAA